MRKILPASPDNEDPEEKEEEKRRNEMNHRFHRAVLAPAVLLLAVLFTACTTTLTQSFTFTVETGDQVKVALDISDGLSLTQEEGTFTVSSGEDALLQGIFLNKDMYDQYLENIAAADAEVLEEASQDNLSYLFYEYEGEAGTEDNFVVWIEDSNTGLLLASLAGQEQAKTGFQHLSFTIE